MPDSLCDHKIYFCGRKVEEDLSKELELDIKGAHKPSIWELLGVRFIVLPYTIGKVRIFKSLSQLRRDLGILEYCYWSVSLFLLLSSHNAHLELNLKFWVWTFLIDFLFHPAITVEWLLVLEIQGETSTIFLGRCRLPNTKIPESASWCMGQHW